MNLSKKQAKSFLLLYHGLLGAHQYEGKDGALAFVRHVAALQYDPIDICGKNAELVLCSRVKHFEKSMLSQLLYEDRALVDYFDKCLSIFPVEDFPYLKHRMMYYYNTALSADKIQPITGKILEFITEHGPTCSKDLDFPEKVDWYWNDSKLSRVALEHLYYNCQLGIAFKKGTIKYYDLLENCMKTPKYRQEYTFQTEAQRFQWHVLRRIKATGLLWNKASDAWLNIHGLTAKNRTEAFDDLVQAGQILALSVEGISPKCYIPSSAKPVLEDVIAGTHHKKRCELIAPLDSLIWDRKLIKALFDFDYKWEIYTPKEKRKYGYYTMPIVYGADFVGRIELQCNRKTEVLTIENLWLEPWFKETKTFHLALNRTIKGLEQLNFLTTKG